MTKTSPGPLATSHLLLSLERGEFSAFSISEAGFVLSREGHLFPGLKIGSLAVDTLFFLDGLEMTIEALLANELASFKLPNVRMMVSEKIERDYTFELTSSPGKDGNQFCVYVWDVTETAIAQQAIVHRHNSVNLENERLEEEKVNTEELMRSQSHFLANISHELRTPLTLALGNCDLLRDQTVYLDEQARNSCLTDIRDNAEELLGFVSDLLDYSKIDAENLVLIDETVDVGAELDRLTQQFRRDALDRRLSLKSQVPPTPIKLRAERRRIRQILTNLLTNALKFTPKGGTVSLGVTDKENGIALFVKDTGLGLTADEMAQIGKPFIKFEKHPLHNQLESNGLGLALTKKLIEAHDGEMVVQSNVGEGTHVTALFPKEKRL